MMTLLLSIYSREHTPGDKALVSSETEGDYYEFDNRIVTTAAGVTRKVGIHREPG